jgi:hypothetical protein
VVHGSKLRFGRRSTVWRTSKPPHQRTPLTACRI